MRKIAKKMQLVLYGLLLPFVLLAQTTTITGKVTDAAGNPLAGATVTARSTNSVVQTDANGAFTIKVSGANPRIIVSFIGFASKTVNATEGVTIKLDEDQSQLSEVVVSGLATTVKRTNSANAVGTISAKQLTGATRPQTLDGAMNGKLPGANIVANGGSPGGGFSVRLRGVSSITQSSEPLYIVDGVYVNNSQFNTGAGTGPFSGATRQTVGTQDQAANRLADLNPQDIESIEVLKGPSAAALYGTRANAGVIIITTKKGKSGKASFQFGQDIGFARALRLTNMHKTVWDKQFTFGTALATGPQLTALKSSLNPTNQTWNYEELVYGNTGFLRNTRLAVTGGNDKVRFYAGGNISDEKGIQKRTGYSRNSVRLNVDLKPFSWLDIGVGGNYLNTFSSRSFSGNDNNGVSLGYNMSYLPNWLPQLPVNGVYPENPLTGQNILEIVDKGVNDETVNRFIQSFSSTLRLLNKGNHKLKIAVQGGIDYLHGQNEVYMPDDVQYQQAKVGGNPPGASRYTNNRNTNANIQGFVVYNVDVKKFSLTTSAGITRLSQDTRNEWIQGEGLKSGQRNPANASVILTSFFNGGEKENGRVIQQEMNWDDKIILAGAVRQDKSSLNGDPNKWFTFPRASAAINIGNFNFWKNLSNTINAFKIRAAYGETGKSAQFGTTFTSLVDAVIGGQSGFSYPTVIGNETIEPERATELEAGIDASFLNNRLSLEFTWYNKKIINLIEAFNLSSGTGVAQIAAFPVGDMQNRGIELGINGTIVSNRNVRWTVNLSWWKNQSKMTKLAIPEKAVAATGFGVFGTQRLRLGASPTAWYGSPNVGGLPTLYEDAQPKWQASLSTSVTFLKNFEFSLLVHRSHKNYNSSINQELTDEGGTTPDWSTLNKDGNPVGLARQLGQPGITTRQFIVDASYTKIREMSLYYTVPKKIFGNLGSKFESLRIGVSGNNVALWTPYYGYDPEAANFGNRPTGATVDLLAYPSSRRLFFHFNLNF
jgi:TonB-linked SusC/RagA family outer membrane protein